MVSILSMFVLHVPLVMTKMVQGQEIQHQNSQHNDLRRDLGW